MRGSHWFIICIVSFLVLMFAIECRLPKKFVWTPTFSHYDKQPFGCAVFDSLLCFIADEIFGIRENLLSVGAGRYGFPPGDIGC